MAGILVPITDVLTKLGTLDVINMDGTTGKLFARTWNDQFRNQEEGDIEAFPLPAAYVEILNPASFQRIGVGFDAGDIIVRIHAGHWQADAGDGTFAQDLNIFSLRDKIVKLISNFKPTGCGLLVHIGDGQNYDHKNVYVYEIDFTCHFIDSKASPYDPDAGKYINSTPPTGLEIDVDKVDSIAGQVNMGLGAFRIPNNKL
jgi:hypothetical protein